MIRTIAVACLLGALVVPETGVAEGSIAYGRGGRTGISYDYRSYRDADERALQECGGNCRIVQRFSNACGAIATGREGGYGYATRPRRGEA